MNINNLFVKAKEKVTIIEIGFFVLFSIGGVIIGEICPIEKLGEIYIKGYITTVLGFIFGTLGFICSLFFRAVHDTIPSMYKHIKKDYEKLEACIEKKDAFLNIKIDRPSVFSLLAEFANDSISHLIGTGEKIFVSEYVRFLESSLEKSSKEFYATSKLTPTTWLNTRLYEEYLDLQIKKKNEYPDIKMARVFLCEKNKFEDDPRKDELINKHKNNGIKIGYYDPENFLKIHKPEFCKDFVKFENDEGAWILDAGQLQDSAKIEDNCKIRFVFRIENLKSEFSDIFRRLENVIWC